MEFEEESEQTRRSQGKSPKACLIIGIGVSDGGLNDLADFFRKIPIATAQGLTFAQISDSELYNTMPNSAIATGKVDYIFNIDEIVQELACHSNNNVVSARAIQGFFKP